MKKLTRFWPSVLFVYGSRLLVGLFRFLMAWARIRIKIAMDRVTTSFSMISPPV